jgi:hypothetical protein
LPGIHSWEIGWDKESRVTENGDAYKSQVEAAIDRAVAAGLTGERFWDELMGADPRLVSTHVSSDAGQPISPDDLLREASARRAAAQLPIGLPAPDPLQSQWWFTLDSVVDLSDTAWRFGGGPAAFLGCPTVGHHYFLRRGTSTTILDVDGDVVSAVSDAIGEDETGAFVSRTYDAWEPLPNDVAAKYAVVVADPPWYPAITRGFLGRARELIGDSGFILLVLPPLLTRPGIIEERSDLLRLLLDASFEIVSLDSQRLTYQVPAFELAVYQDLPQFSGRPWRKGDLLVLRVGPATGQVISEEGRPATRVVSFSRRRTRYRAFVRATAQMDALEAWASPIPGFTESVSTRGVSLGEIGAWGSDRRGVRVRSADVTLAVLQAWQEGATASEAVTKLTAGGRLETDARMAVDQLQEGLQIWRDDSLVAVAADDERLREDADGTPKRGRCSTVTADLRSSPGRVPVGVSARSRSHPMV